MVKPLLNNRMSTCCGAQVTVEGDTTMYYVCIRCNKACNTVDMKAIVQKANQEQKVIKDGYSMNNYIQQKLSEFDKIYHKQEEKCTLVMQSEIIDAHVDLVRNFLEQALKDTIHMCF